jgi:hypothetical protein
VGKEEKGIDGREEGDEEVINGEQLLEGRATATRQQRDVLRKRDRQRHGKKSVFM